LISNVIKTIEDETFRERSRSESSGKGFSRNRKLTFIHLIVLLTQGLTRSIQREVNSFYQKLLYENFSLQHVTKGAFSKARAKLRPEAFVELTQVCNQCFYGDAPYNMWRQWRLVAIDGSTAVLPNHDSIKQEFGVINYGPHRNSPRSIARVSVLYDVLNFIVLDGQIADYATDERELATRHFDQLEAGGDLLLLDRGYPSYLLMYKLQQKGIDYCIRLCDDWWKEVRKMLAEGEVDKGVIFELSAKDKKAVTADPSGNYQVNCRLVAITLEDGTREILCTSVRDKEALPYECFADLYHCRWNIEEGYKLFKNRLQLEAFSGKTATAVKQDFFAKLFMMSLTAALAFPIEEKLLEEQQNQSRKHPYKINKTNALAFTREIVQNLFIKKIIKPALEAMDKVLKATVELVRPNRKEPRNKIKKKPPSMNYKQL
jgi:hypothetical protein